jgi:peptidoglycan-associated lipoprotein
MKNSLFAMRSCLLMLLVTASVSAPTAQPLRKSSRESNLEAAYEKMAVKDYYQAVTLLEKAYEDQEDEALVPMLAEMNFKLRDYTKAVRYYGRMFRKDKEKKFESERFNYARALKMNGDYETAAAEFQKVIANTADEKIKELAGYEATGCELAQSKAKPKVAPTALGKTVSRAFSEYSPAPARDGSLYYVGFDTDEVYISNDTAEEKSAKIYQVRKNDKGWGKPEPLDEKINREGFQNSFVSFSSDGNRMYLTRGALGEGNELINSKIYMSTGGDGAWTGPQECVGVNGDFIALHPVVGELFGKEVLFFSANMAGGQGGFDLYYATYKGEGTYADPVNLGPKINTPADEITPFYYNGTMYFSSSGHPGYGGQDIFFSVWNGQVWSEPRNLAGGYNTSQDDQYFTLTPDGYRGYFTSNRPDGRSVRSKTCCDDIYEFEVPRIKADLVVGIFDNGKKPVALKGGTTDLSGVTVAGVQPIELKTNATGNRFDFGLNLDKTYKIKVNVPGYYPDSAQVTTNNLKETKVFEQRFFLKPLPTTKVVEDSGLDTITIEQAFVLENIVYEYDKADIKPEAEPDLQLVLDLMKKYPDMVIELGSHTDYRGIDKYNQDLSQRRAESARRWLVNKGIATSRILAQGYGESKPKPVSEKMAAENLFMKMGDTLTREFIDNLASKEQQEEAHQLNRRTEFKIVKGPKSITVKRVEVRKKPATQGTKPAPNRNHLPGATPVALPPRDTLSPWSNLYKREDLKRYRKPVMQFSQRSIDLGTIKEGEKISFSYPFVNRGNQALTIDFISTCDCVSADFPKNAIRPGGKGVIKIIFDSKAHPAEQMIELTVVLKNKIPFAKDPKNFHPIREELQFNYKLEGAAEIHKLSALYDRKDLHLFKKPILVFNTREINLGKVKKGEKREFEFEFTNQGEVPAEIDLISACECTTTDFEHKPINPGEKAKIKVTFDSADKTAPETIDVDIILKNEIPYPKDPKIMYPLIERVKYSFDLAM